MDRKKLLKSVLFLMFFILGFYYIGLRFYWDYTTWWWDVIAHFLGGFWQGLFFLWFFSIKDLPFLKPSLNLNDSKLAWKAIFYVLLIGLLWELFEFYANNYVGLYPFDIFDTTSDILLDLAGGFFSIQYFLKKIMPSNQNKVE